MRVRWSLLLLLLVGGLWWPALARADWSPARVLASGSPSPFARVASAVDARGDAAVAWETVGPWPARSAGRRCSPSPTRAGCFPVTTVRVGVRLASGRLLTRTLWSQRADPGMQLSVVMSGAEVTVAWSYAVPAIVGETVRAAFGPLTGRWPASRTIGGPWSVGYVTGGPVAGVALAIAPDGTVLAAWNGCAARSGCEAQRESVVAVWRPPGRAFGTPSVVAVAPLGATPAFDVAGRAYLVSGCSGEVAVALPGSRRFHAVTVANGPVWDFSLSLAGGGRGLAAWVAGACSHDEMVPNPPGALYASVLSAGVFGAPTVLAPADARADYVAAVATAGGGGSVSWTTAPINLTAYTVALSADGAAGAVGQPAAGVIPTGHDGGGDILLSVSPRSSGAGSRELLMQPAGGAPDELSPAPSWGAVAVAAPRGRAVAVAWWSSPTGSGSLELTVWQPARSWSSGLRGSRDPDVSVLVRALALRLRQIRLPDGVHERPVAADRAALEAPPAQAERLDRRHRNPDRREHVAVAAADDDVAAQRVAAAPRDDRPGERAGGGER